MCFWEVVLILRLTAYWKYQSNGWCHDHCVGGYAFAIVQDFNCWCSNYAPGVTSSLDNCDTGCPGYTEFCGGNGFYGYIALNKTSSGTVGASGLAASSTPVSHPSRQDPQVNMLHLQSLFSSSYCLETALDLLYYVNNFSFSSKPGNCYCEWCSCHYLLYGCSNPIAEFLNFTLCI